VPLRRADVYAWLVEEGYSAKTADLFAFGPHTTYDDAEPLTLAEFQAVLPHP
jgi:hypothetical protein